MIDHVCAFRDASGFNPAVRYSGELRVTDIIGRTSHDPLRVVVNERLEAMIAEQVPESAWKGVVIIERPVGSDPLGMDRKTVIEWFYDPSVFVRFLR